ncbi:MAG: group II intron reverse transcriptase/maturase [Gammaproteobacteria bacterium]|nr:group II intron reverse transcriptase/maturase [Gammaproteobacteria bacterium]
MSVHSEDRETWLTKLERIGKLSAEDAGMIFNNLGHIINTDMLKEQYRKLDAKKAVGIDGLTKQLYGENLDENICNLIKRIRKGSYQPKPARITEIPKEDGSTRPLAISCFEDKLVQLSVSILLSKIYEPLFLPCSYGFREGKSGHDALKALNQATFRNWNGSVIEIDIRKYFNTIPHQALMQILSNKISDRRLMRLIEVLITAPILEHGNINQNTEGCPQGSILSPILANIYLHHVIDEWFEHIKQTHIHGRADLIRYADDMVFCFEHMSDAKRFYEALPKRLNKFGLTLHPDKSQIIAAGHYAAQRAHAESKRLATFNFLGFTCYWGKTKSGYWRLKFSSRKDRFAAKLKGLRKYLRENLNTYNTQETLKAAVSVIRGWVNYHNISDNHKRVKSFVHHSRMIIFQWFNRKGGQKKMTWTRCNAILEAIGLSQQYRAKSMFN